jgi:DNA-binding Lrp family transcriptional regulator
MKGDKSNHSKGPRRLILEQQAWGLAARGLSQEVIAAKLGVSQPTVSRMLARAEDRAIKAADAYVKGVKVRQTAILEAVVCEALQAWEKSKRDGRKRKVRSTTIRAPNGEGRIEIPADEVTREVSRRDGNPAFLSEVRAALADIREVWGLDRDEQEDEAGPATNLDRIATAVLEAAAGLPLPEADKQLVLEHLSRSLLSGGGNGDV